METYSVLLVDDETKITEMLGKFLGMKGFSIHRAGNGKDALSIARSTPPDIVLLDIRMPVMDGVECLKAMKKMLPQTEVIMVTATTEIETAVSCLQEGAFGFLTKPIDLQMVTTEVDKALEHRKLLLSLKDYQDNLEKKVQERTAEITRLNSRLKDNFLRSIRMLIGLLETYDPFIGGHLRRVAQLVREMSKRFNLPPKESLDMEMAALLHDIGTISLPKLLKEAHFSDLAPEEIAFIKQHPVFAQNILSPMSELEKAGQIIRSHLERLDGGGFPDGLVEEKIPFGSRLLGAANAYDEIVSRRRFTHETLETDEEKSEFALKILFSASGKQFQWDIVKCLEETVERMNQRAGRTVKVEFAKLQPGMVLGRDLYTREGMLLLAKGFTLDDGILRQISVFMGMKLIHDDFRVTEGSMAGEGSPRG